VAGAPGDRSPHIDRFDPTCHAQTVLVGPTLGFQRLSRHLILRGCDVGVEGSWPDWPGADPVGPVTAPVLAYWIWWRPKGGEPHPCREAAAAGVRRPGA